MGRHERRRQEREAEKQARKNNVTVQKPVLVPLGATQVLARNMAKDSLRPVVNETMLSTFEIIMRVMALAINTQEGWGKVRIQRLIDRIMLQFDCITAGTLTGADIMEFCKEKNINVEVTYDSSKRG